MNNLELEQKILDIVGQPGYQPVKARVLAKKLKATPDQARDVKRAVKRLVRHGRLGYAPGRQVVPADPTTPKSNRLVGIFQRAAKGYGFVRPSPAPGVTADRSEAPRDIYVPAKWSGDAASGDVVLVQLRKPRRGGPRGAQADRGPRGEIVEVIERETHQFVGTYFESGGSAYVQVDGAVFAQPILVGDPGAKGAQPDEKVVIEMVRFPSAWHDGEGVITEVLGPRGKPGVDTLSIIREFDLPEAFPADALDDARGAADRFDESIGERLDLTGETIVTIDPADARDFDDAISLVREPSGNWLLGVHIADVAHFVRPDTALDREARQRATSVYLPDRVLPMLPEVISNALASLQPGKVRYAKSVLMEITPEGTRVATELSASAIRSTKRLNYEEVDRFLADPKPWRRRWGAAVCDLLLRMHELAMMLRRRRFARGALELVMPEVKVDLDAQGRVSGAHVVEHTESHQIIEEFMLAANEAVAERLRDKELPFLRRVHPEPNLRKLKALAEFVAELGIAADGLESRFKLQELLADVAGQPTQHAVNYAVLRSLQRAIYSPEEEGHYALASDCYCHFTSPIRRYPDLTVHRTVEAMLAGRTPRDHYDELVVLGRHCSQREQRAEAAERDLTKLKLLHHLSERIGEQLDAVITGVENFGLFVQGTELPAEGLIHAQSLVDDYYRFDRTAHALVGTRTGNVYRLGDRVRVAVGRVDLDRRELDFRLVARQKPAPGPRKRKRAARSQDDASAQASTGRGRQTTGRRRERSGPAPKKPAKKGKGGRGRGRR